MSIYRDRNIRVKVDFNVSIFSIYNMGQEKYNSTVGTKLDILVTVQEQ